MLLKPAAVPERATLLPEPQPVTAFELLDQDGKTFTGASFRGRWSLVFFGFTHCPDVCPLTLGKLQVARQQMAEQLDDEALPDIVFISVDPARDTVDAVGAYAGAFGAGAIGVTGDLAEIDKLTRSLGIFHARTDDGQGSYSVEHSAAIIVIDDEARFHAVFSAPHDAEVIARDMSLIMAAR